MNWRVVFAAGNRNAVGLMALTGVLSLLPSAASAQYPPYPIPTEAAVGPAVLNPLGGAIVGSLSWDYDQDWWAVPVLEGEFNSLTEAEPCHGADPPDSCGDGVVAGSVRFRPVPHVWSGAAPFATVMVGAYWTGSGAADRAFVSTDVSINAGVGVDFRWPGSFQGVRVSLDYRAVFVDHGPNRQLRVVGAYVVGPRRFKRRTGG